MLILGDETHDRGRMPWVTFTLVAVNMLVYGIQCRLGEPLTNGCALVPAEITKFKDLTKKETLKVKVFLGYRYDGRGKATPRYETQHVPINHYQGPIPIHLTLLTSLFLHGDFWHLLGNMWFLLVFGRNVECSLGHGRYILFYLVAGALAGLAQTASEPGSIVPCVGASGAISGVMGAYVAIHPFNKIKVWMGWWFGVVDLPALVVLGIWFLLQYLHANLALEHPEFNDGVAYWDHVGGFIAGVIMIRGFAFYLQCQIAKLQNEIADAKEWGGRAPVDDAIPPAPVPLPAEAMTGFSSAPLPQLPPALAPAAAAPDPFGSFLPAPLPRPKPEPKPEPVTTFSPGPPPPRPASRPESQKPLW